MTKAAVELEIDAFLGKYTPAMEAQLREALARLRAHFRHGFELVFDNYNALVFGISPSERSNDAFVSLAGYPKWVTLFFLHGASLPDPHGLLLGEGKQVRSIRLKSPDQLNEPRVEELIMQAALPRRQELEGAPALATVVKMVVTKQRARRP